MATFDNGQLNIVDSDAVGKDNLMTVSVVGTDLVIHDANEQFVAAPAGGTLSDGDQTLTIPLNLLPAGLKIDAGGGDDEIDVDSLGSTFSGNLEILGGTGVDTVTFQTGAITVGSGSVDVAAEFIDVESSLSASGAVNLTSTGDDALLSISDVISAGADSKFAADKMAINATVEVGSHVLTLVPESSADAGDFIDIGAVDDSAANTLQLSDEELDHLSAATIVIGDLETSTITVTSAIQQAGDSNIQVVTGRDIVFNLLTSWATDNGNLSFTANPNAAAMDSFWGIALNGVTLSSSGSGNISIDGHGGVGGIGNFGIMVYDAAVVESTGTGLISIIGVGGVGSQNDQGIQIEDVGTRISSATGHILIQGQGGASTTSYGVFVHNGAVIESTDTATVTIDGTGADFDVSNGVTLSALAAPTRIASVNGDIHIIGHGGNTTNGFATRGIAVNDGVVIQSTGTAKIALDGTGGDSLGSSRGIELQNGSQITSETGNIQITGHGGDNDLAFGVWVATGSSVVSTGTAQISIEGTGGAGGSGSDGVQISEATTKITSLAGAIHITGTGGDGIGDQNQGVWLATGATVSSSGTASITIEGTGGAGVDENNGVLFNGYGVTGATNVTSVDGDITIIGHGASSTTGPGNRGIGMFAGAVIESTGLAKITLDGTGGAGSDTERGVEMTNAGTRITSQTGDIEITGKGGQAPGSHGVSLWDGASIESTGTAQITVEGTGGDGASDTRGVQLTDPTTKITSVAGNVDVIGRGGDGIGDFNMGVWIVSGATISSTSTASITIDGTGGSGGSENNGVLFNGYGYNSSSNVTSVDGDITIIGHGASSATGVGNRGIGMFAGAVIESTGLAKITLDGTGGTGSGTERGVEMTNAGTRITSLTGDIKITGTGGAAPSSHGVSLWDGGTIESTGTAQITVDGTGGGGASDTRGVQLTDPATKITSVVGNIHVTGQGGDGIGDFNMGVWLVLGATISSTSTASITIEGTGGAGVSENNGVLFNGYGYGNSSKVTSVDGDITITGHGATDGTGTGNRGIGLYLGSYVQSTGLGKITLDGTGGAGSDSALGVELADEGTTVTSVSSDIQIIGHGGTSASAYGVRVLDGASVQSTGSAKITLDGTGGNGSDSVGTALNTGRVTSVDGDITLLGQGGTFAGGAGAIGVFLLDGSLVESTGNAKVFINGTGGTSGSSVQGVYISDAGTAVRTVTGDIEITGEGGDGTGDNVVGNIGVWLVGGATVVSSGSASITIDGTGGNGISENNGVLVNGYGTGGTTSVISVDGDISIIGHGASAGTGVSNRGIGLFPGTLIQSTGLAKITLDGTGGSGSANAMGIELNQAGTLITSADGDIQLTGHAGANPAAFGIWLFDGPVIESTGSAKITLDGTGGVGAYNFGVAVNTSRISSVDGDISLLGHAGTASEGADATGVWLLDGALVESTGNAKIAIDGAGGTADSAVYGVKVSDPGTVVRSAAGDIEITGHGGAGTSGYGVYILGGAVVDSTGTADVTINGTSGDGNDRAGVMVGGEGTAISVVDGDISITGESQSVPGATTPSWGFYLSGGAVIQSSGTGAIAIDGTGGSGLAFQNGVEIATAGTKVTSARGDISIVGHGGTSSSGDATYSHGVLIRDGATVESTATEGTAAKIDINGTGGIGAGADLGVWISAGHIASILGDIHVTGQGGSGTGYNNIGVILQYSGLVESTGSAKITLDGTGGDGLGSAGGVYVIADSIVQTADGDVAITGIGGGDVGSGGNQGVLVQVGDIKATAGGTANIVITGIAGPGSSGIYFNNDVAVPGIETSAGTGNIKLIADSMQLLSGAINAGTNTMTILPKTDGTAIDLGGDDSAGTLGLSDAELDLITAADLNIGDLATGAMTVSASVTRSSTTDTHLTSGGDILISGGQVDTSGGSLVLTSGLAPDVIDPSHAGVDVAASVTTLDGDLSIAINGAVVDMGFTQLNVVGGIDLNGVNLELSGDYTPVAGDSFVIVSNDSDEPVAGIFHDLEEGDILVFNGIGLKITYHGGTDGNDVVLTTSIEPPVANDASLAVTEDLPSSGMLPGSDVDSISLAYSIVSNPTHGTVTITNAATGAYTYTPNANYHGPDSFTYRVNDGSQDSNIGIISITVDEANDAPQLNLNGDAVTFSAKDAKRGGPIKVVPNVTVVDIDQSPAFAVGGGTLTISIDVSAKVTKKSVKQHDTIGGLSNASLLGTTTGPAYQNGKSVLTISLGAGTTTADIESFLRGITFTTKGPGLKQNQRIFQATVVDAAGATSNVLSQTIKVSK